MKGRVVTRLHHVERSLRIQQLGFRDQFARHEIFGSLQLDLGLGQVCLRQRLRRDRRLVGGLRRIPARLVIVRFDLHEQFALPDRLTFLDRKLRDFSAHLGIDHDLNDRLNLPIRHDEFRDAAPADLLRLHREHYLALVEMPERPPATGGHED